LRQIRLAPVDGRRRNRGTSLRFTDTEPIFTLDAKHLAFQSVRTLDPA
jgi:tricorn protease-like protein